MKEFTCAACGSHQYYVDANPGAFTIRYCVKCDVPSETAPQTIVVEAVNHNEVTSIAEIAMNYLVGRKMVIGRQNVYIQSVWRTTDSRMALTVALENGTVQRLYLPTKIELVPLEQQNAEQDDAPIYSANGL
jgi:hypothetical protein